MYAESESVCVKSFLLISLANSCNGVSTFVRPLQLTFIAKIFSQRIQFEIFTGRVAGPAALLCRIEARTEHEKCDRCFEAERESKAWQRWVERNVNCGCRGGRRVGIQGGRCPAGVPATRPRSVAARPTRHLLRRPHRRIQEQDDVGARPSLLRLLNVLVRVPGREQYEGKSADSIDKVNLRRHRTLPRRHSTRANLSPTSKSFFHKESATRSARIM